jgi:cysteine desulfurase
MFAPTYLDHNATTPIDARVFDAMLPYLRERFGNPSSRHEYGRQTRDAIERARYQVAEAVGAHPTEVIFTSGGSEANNLFLKGAAARMEAGVLAIGASEHPCVTRAAQQLAGQGWQLQTLPLNSEGALDVAAAASLCEQVRPKLVSVMLANNETGVLNAVAGLAQQVRSRGAWVHTDAVQALGKYPIDFRVLGVHGMTLSAHKIHGPVGAGALVVDKRVDLAPLVAGGGQERGLRSGTENVAAIVGFGQACELVKSELQQRIGGMQQAHAELERGLLGLGAKIFGAGALRLPNTSYLAFAGIDGETLVGRLDRAGFAVASGAACSSANPEPSRTLLAMGVVPELARCAIRVSLGPETSRETIERFLSVLQQTVNELRQLTALAV